MSTSTSAFTPLKRLVLALAALVFVLASHDVLVAGFMLQAVWIVLGAGLVRLLMASAVPTRIGWPLGRRASAKPVAAIARPARVSSALAFAEVA